MHGRLEPAQRDQTIVLRPRGDIQLDEAAELYTQLSKLARQHAVQCVRISFAEVVQLDSAGAVAAKLGAEQLRRAGKGCDLQDLRPQHQQALALVSEPRELVKKPREPSRAWMERLYTKLSRARVLIDAAELVVDTAWSGLRALAHWERRRLGAVAEHTVTLGVDATFIVSLLSFLIGVILAFQGAFQLRRFGADVYMAELVGLGMVREFSAIMTAIILAGRSGAALAAELGTMSVQNEIDALETMGISIPQYLVFPRVLALSIAQPFLTVLSMAIGIGAGIGLGSLVGIPAWTAFHRMQQALVLDDFVLGLVKSLLFAWVIGFVGCFMGLATRGGAQNVGTNTTRAVVLSIVLIVVIDSIVTTTWTLSYGGNRS